MALTRRVWHLGKLLLLAGALAATYLVFFALAMRIANKAREVTVPVLAGRSVNEATATVADVGLTLRVEDRRRPTPKCRPGASSCRSRCRCGGPAPALGEGLAQRRSERARRACPGRGAGTHGPAQAAKRGAAAGESCRDSIGRPCAGHGRGASARRDARAGAVSLLVNRGRRSQLCDAGSHRRQRRTGLTDLLRAGVPRRGRQLAALPRRAAGHRAAPAAAGRLPGGPGRSDFPRGEPVSVRIAPSILSADFAALGRAVAAAERGGADSHPRGRDGRSFRAQHHRRPAGRAGHQARRAASRSTST